MNKIESGIDLMNRFTKKPIELHLLCESQNFPDLNSFLHLIDPLHPYNLKTVESYLFGNDLTRSAPKADLIAQYRHFALPEIADSISLLLPPEIYPTHFFQVAFIATADPGDATTKINACAIFPAKVVSLNGFSATVVRPIYPTFQKIEQTVDFIPDQNLVIGNLVAVHLGSAITTLTQKQFNNLDFWNRKVASLI